MKYIGPQEAKDGNRTVGKYFDLTRNYASLRMSAGNRNEFISRAMKYGCGLRVLRQDPWEMLITFIPAKQRAEWTGLHVHLATVALEF